MASSCLWVQRSFWGGVPSWPVRMRSRTPWPVDKYTLFTWSIVCLPTIVVTRAIVILRPSCYWITQHESERLVQRFKVVVVRICRLLWFSHHRHRFTITFAMNTAGITSSTTPRLQDQDFTSELNGVVLERNWNYHYFWSLTAKPNFSLSLERHLLSIPLSHLD